MRKILKIILRKINFKGKRRIIKFFFKNHYFVGALPVDGYRMKIDTHFAIDWEMYWMKGYERNVVQLLDRFIRSDFVSVDIGANIGVYTLPMARASARVISFEPYFGPLLRENLALNGIMNVVIKETFLSDKEGEADLFTSATGNNYNNTRTIAPLFSGTVKEMKVRVKTLDQEVKERVGFIKIDTDGTDPKIIWGGKNLIEKFRPIIIFEICGSRSGDYDAALDRSNGFLSDLGYQLFTISKRGALERFVLPPPGVETNVLALPEKTA